MKRLLETKLIIVLLACGGLVALVLLSAALRHFAFEPSLPFSLNIFGGFPALAEQNGSIVEIPIWKFLMFGFLVLTICVVFFILLDAEARKSLLRKLFRLAVTMLCIWIVMNYAYQKGSLKQLINLAAAAGEGAAASPQTVIPEYVQPHFSPWLIFAVSFVVGLALILLGWYIFLRRSRSRNSSALKEIAGIAREALQGLTPGHDWDEAIVRAYVRMNEVVVEQRRLIRQPGVTPSEFAQRMERAGLPGEAVQTLTRLFEGVRYGGKSSTPAERDLAAAALSAIVHACGVNL